MNSGRNFQGLLEAKWAEGKFVCVGLDSELERIPSVASKVATIARSGSCETVLEFNRRIIDATVSIAGAYKPNAAFYEALGDDGFHVLRETINYVHLMAPETPVILDAKRMDIGNSNKGYVKWAFQKLQADAITIHGTFGQEGAQPFLDEKDKGIIVLCRTSNKGAAEFQNRLVELTEEEAQFLIMHGKEDILTKECFIRWYQLVALRVSQFWNANNNCLVVVGATAPQELESVRSLVGDMGILAPGIGTQGGDLERTVKAGKNSKNQGLIINSSSGIIFASAGEDYADKARAQALQLHNEIQKHLN